MPRPPTPSVPPAELREQLRTLITPEQPPRPTRDGDLPTGNLSGAGLSDRWTERTIQVMAGAYGDVPLGANQQATLIVRWAASRDSEGGMHDELHIEGMHGITCERGAGESADFSPAHPHFIRGLATLLTELADRVDADRAAYALLDQVRR